MNSKLKDVIIGLACAALAIYLLYIIGLGVVSGEITQLAKYSQKIILRSEQPQHFWATLAFFSLGVLMLLKTALKKLFPNRHL